LRTRARAVREIRPPDTDATSDAGTPEVAVKVEENFSIMEDVTLHCPAMPVYEQLAPVNGVVRIGVPESTKPKKAIQELTRRDKALLAVAVKQGEENLSTWSIADLAKLFSASPRSAHEASKLSLKERNAVANGDRPLFPPHSSVPAPLSVFDPHVAIRQIIETVGSNTALDLLAAAESEKAKAAA
jgi:hypothetical protein